jgi:hypothetical protein
MFHILYAILLSSVLMGLSLIYGEFGDISHTVQTWLGSFILPIWSLFTISLWHDIGRLIWAKTFKVDTEDSTTPTDLRSLIFIVWMSIIFTYVIWVHISLLVIPLLLVIPFLGIPFRNLLIQDWSTKPTFTREQVLGLVFWASTSYLVYWFLTIGWILIRVWILETFNNGIVYYIQ